MRKTRGHPKLAVVVLTQLLSNPLAKSGRAFADVHSDIDHRTANHPHKFALGLLDLVMQTAQHALGTAAVVVLHKLVVGTRGVVEGLLIEAFKEKASGVTEHLGFDEDDFRDGCAYDIHGEV